MEIFGLPLQEFIFNVFLPFLLFYLLIYALLEKSKIFGEKAKSLNVLTALTFSAIGTYSIFSLGVMSYLTWVVVGTILTAFVGLFVFGSMHYSFKKTEFYYTEEDRKKFEDVKENLNSLWLKLQEAIKAGRKEDIGALTPQLISQIKILEELAPKLKKDLRVELPWYETFMRILKKSD